MENRISPLMEQEKEASRPGLTSLSVLKSLLIRLLCNLEISQIGSVSVFFSSSLISRFEIMICLSSLFSHFRMPQEIKSFKFLFYLCLDYQKCDNCNAFFKYI